MSLTFGDVEIIKITCKWFMNHLILIPKLEEPRHLLILITLERLTRTLISLMVFWIPLAALDTHVSFDRLHILSSWPAEKYSLCQEKFSEACDADRVH